ncbi:MAG: hypothetical protein JW864_00360 [Spirochaetes bacterium]|nr:hypothetical protein [Spirochaetota bacterium]
MNQARIPLRKTGMVIALMNLIIIINAAAYFLFKLKFPFIAWIAFNACAPSVLIFLAGFFSKQRAIMTASLPFLLFFGIDGLFEFGWTGFDIITQVGHILMILAALYIIIIVIIEKKWKPSLAGFIAGLIFFLALIPHQQGYVASHQEFLKKIAAPVFK